MVIASGYTQKGFSVIELLVVIAIIGVIAAIVTAGYTGIQKKSYDSTVQGDLLDNMKALGHFYADNSKYPTKAQLATLNPKLSFVKTNYDTNVDAVLYCRKADGTAAALIAESKSGAAFVITSSNKNPVVATFTFPNAIGTACTSAGVPDPVSVNGGGWLHLKAAGWDAAVAL